MTQSESARIHIHIFRCMTTTASTSVCRLFQHCLFVMELLTFALLKFLHYFVVRNATFSLLTQERWFSFICFEPESTAKFSFWVLYSLNSVCVCVWMRLQCVTVVVISPSSRLCFCFHLTHWTSTTSVLQHHSGTGGAHWPCAHSSRRDTSSAVLNLSLPCFCQTVSAVWTW